MYNGGTPSNVLTLAGSPVTIAAPTNLTATLAGTTANLSWTDNATNETGYVVERSTNGGTFTQIASVAAGTGTGTRISYSDPNLTNGTYTYRVKGVNGPASSLYSNTASVNVVNNAPTLKAPSNLSARNSGTSVSLSFNDNASNETGFVLERSTDGVNFTAIANIGAAFGTGNTVRYTDTQVTPGTTYTYRVKAVNGSSSSAYSNTAMVTTPTIPAAPTSLSAGNITNGRTTDSVPLSWTMPSGTVTSYVIQYATDSAFKQNVRTKTVTGQNGKAPGTSTTLSGLTKRRTYYIRIQAVNGAVSSPWSSAITVYTP
jgi:hypothetical protein